MQLTRRHFIGLGLTTLTGGALLAGADWLSRRAGGPGLGDVGTIVAEPDVWGAQRIGDVWLAGHPEEASRAELERLLAPLPAAPAEWSLHDPTVREWLRARQQADFADGHIVKLNGWWLSQTEVRFCALLALA